MAPSPESPQRRAAGRRILPRSSPAEESRPWINLDKSRRVELEASARPLHIHQSTHYFALVGRGIHLSPTVLVSRGPETHPAPPPLFNHLLPDHRLSFDTSGCPAVVLPRLSLQAERRGRHPVRGGFQVVEVAPLGPLTTTPTLDRRPCWPGIHLVDAPSGGERECQGPPQGATHICSRIVVTHRHGNHSARD